jgi:hypothetical protein
MMSSHSPAVALFIVRAWYEDDQFRAHVTRSLDVNTEIETRAELLTADPQRLVEFLGTWLRDLARHSAGGCDDPTRPSG